MSQSLIDTRAIAGMLGMSTKHVRERLVRRPDFPRPALQLSVKTRRWDLADVQVWLEKQRKKCAR
jgi:predicted DNA-binding transcriptional regulator AlpA